MFLDENNIGDEGMEYLSEALKSNETLKVLNFNGNKIGDAGLRFLLAAGRVTTSLIAVDLSFDNADASDEAKQAVTDALKDMPARRAAREEYLVLRLPHGQVRCEAVRRVSANVFRLSQTSTALELF